MANFGQLLLTNLGIQEQYKAQAGTPLKFKRIGMGSGNYTGNIMALTKLVTENVSVDISKGYMQNNAFTIEGFFSNEGLQTGFAWREIGVFVEDSNGNEVLYCYANAGDSYDYIPATADERYSKYIRVATAIGNASNVSIVEKEGFIYVDIRAFEELKTEVASLYPTKEVSGTTVVIEDSANLPLAGLHIYGKSTQDGNPTPDAPVDIVSVGDDGDIAVYVYGKNLCNMDAFDSMGINATANTYDAATHTITMNEDSGGFSGRYGSPFKHCEIGKKYTVSFDIRGTAGRMASCGWDTARVAITLTSEYKRYHSTIIADKSNPAVTFYTRAVESGGLAAGEWMQFANVQIECGDVATEFEEYKTVQSMTLPTPNGLPGIPVTSGGNYTDADGQMWVCDEIDFTRGRYIQRIQEIVIDGTQPIATDGAESNPWRKYIWINNAPADTRYGGLCNRLRHRDSHELIHGNDVSDSGFSLSEHHNVIYFNVGYLMSEDTIEAAQDVLTEYPLTIKYALATPVETALTDAQMLEYRKLATNNPNTTILNDSGAWIDAEYITKTYEAVSKTVASDIVYESAEYPGCRYRIVDGEIEWINPPMVTGKAQRTSERFGGQPVYVTRSAYNVEAQSSQSISLSGIAVVVDHKVLVQAARGNKSRINYFETSYLEVEEYTDSRGIQCIRYINNSDSEVNIRLIIKFTKEG